MERRLPFLFFISSLVVLCWGLPISAKAPKTAKIAFWADLAGTRDIYLMNPDGSQRIKITHHRSQNITPVWSPTGEQILFTSDRDGVWDLYLMDPDGTNVQRVFEKTASRIGAAWSPDGKQIAYTRLMPEGRVVHIATLGEEDEERIAMGGHVAWSPEGTELAFITGWGTLKKMQISLFDLRTGKQKTLFPPKAIPSQLYGVQWSPRGDKLAFSWLHRVPLGDFIEAETIYTMKRDGTDITQIIDEAGPKATAPAWSPNSNALLYRQVVPGRDAQIFKVNLEGEQPEQLTHIGRNFLGDWFDPAYALSVSPQPQLLTTTWGGIKSGD
ncbi:MAG: hypothetical protein OXI61_07310 [Candidatus Poribacteria bacterium]|nr:hypothetical protein [Candidatus Poribacteria bacterium]